MDACYSDIPRAPARFRHAAVECVPLIPGGARDGTTTATRRPHESDGLASLLCSSIGWLFIIGPILGLIFGFLALNQIKQTGQRGRGLAIAGIVIGAVLFAIITSRESATPDTAQAKHGFGRAPWVVIVEPQAVSPFQPI